MVTFYGTSKSVNEFPPGDSSSTGVCRRDNLVLVLCVLWAAKWAQQTDIYRQLQQDAGEHQMPPKPIHVSCLCKVLANEFWEGTREIQNKKDMREHRN